MRETIIQSKILAILNHRDAPCRLWRNNVGEMPTPNGGRLKYGLGVGSADLIGLVIATGQFLACEIKTPIGKLSKEQKAWLATIRNMGGRAYVLRTVEEAQSLVDELRGLKNG